MRLIPLTQVHLYVVGVAHEAGRSQCSRSSGRGPRPHDALAARSHAGYGKLLAALRSRPQSSMTNSGPWAYAYAGAISGEGDALATIKATAP